MVIGKTGTMSAAIEDRLAGKKEGATIITDQVQGKQVNKVLTDYLPDFEI